MKLANGASSLVVGSRVLFSQSHAGLATIVAIHGTQNGGQPGGAEFDVVFDNGHVALCVPESIVRGPHWRVSTAVHTPTQIETAKWHAAEVGRRRRAESDAVRADHDQAVATLRTNPVHAALTQGADATGKVAAINIRKQLVTSYPATRFRVRLARKGALAIAWTDGPTATQLLPITTRHLDGIGADTPAAFECVPNPWAEVFGAIRSVATHRSTSPALLERAIAAVFTACEAQLRGSWRPTPEDVTTGHAWGVDVPGTGSNLQQLIERAAAAMEGE